MFYYSFWRNSWEMQLQWLHSFLHCLDWSGLSHTDALGMGRGWMALWYVCFLSYKWWYQYCSSESSMTLEDLALFTSLEVFVLLSQQLFSDLGLADLVAMKRLRFQTTTNHSHSELALAQTQLVLCWLIKKNNNNMFLFLFWTKMPDPGIAGHSIPFISLGAFILIFGFFAFNGGSQVIISY